MHAVDNVGELQVEEGTRASDKEVYAAGIDLPQAGIGLRCYKLALSQHAQAIYSQTVIEATLLILHAPLHSHLVL